MTENILDTAKLCSLCFQKFNNYDKHQTAAFELQKELTSLYKRGDPATIIFIKSETDHGTPDFNGSPFEVFDVLDKVCVKLEDYGSYSETILLDNNENRRKSVSREGLLPRKTAGRRRRTQSSDNQLAFSAPGRPVSNRKSVKSRNTLVKEDLKLPKVKNKIPKSYKTSLEDEIKSGLFVIVIEGVRHYRCEVCQKTYTCKSQLRIHKMTHGEERNFICDVSEAIRIKLDFSYIKKNLFRPAELRSRP